MATAIWTGIDAGQVLYDLSYDASRPSADSTTVNITFYLRAYLKWDNSYFGYDIVVQNLWCAGNSIATNHQIKAASPNKFDFTTSFSTSVQTTESSVWGVRLIMTSTLNDGSSGKCDTGADVSISVPAYTPPSVPPSQVSSISVPSSVAHNSAVTFSWSGASAGSRPIWGYDLRYRLYNGSSWTDWVGLGSTTSTSYTLATTNTLNINGVTTSAYGTNMKIQVAVQTSDGISLVSGFKTSSEISVTKLGKLMYKDNSGTIRELTKLKIKDSSGTLRNGTAMKIKDSSGNIRTIEFIQT